MHITDQLNTALTGRYAIDRLVGEGGMATVYLARDLRHNRNVALKVLRADLGAAVGVKRFLTEIQVTANLQHPNLLPLFDSGAAGELLFYVMPYVDGESLRARLDRENQLPVEFAVHIATAVASALDYAHRQGVIHRDLKPGNILLREGEPLVADFGIALAVSNAGGNRITQTGISLGTPQYMSPEQAAGDRTIDARTDIYSLGAVTYEMLTGEAPHTGTTSQAIIARVLTEKPRSIRASRPNVPAYVEGAVERALEKLPADRFASAKEFGEALAGARPVTTTVPLGTRGGAVSPLPRGLRGREIAFAAVALAGLVTTAWMLVREGRAVPAAPVEFELRLPDSLEATGNFGVDALALSRDGSVLVFQAKRGTDSRQALYVRRLDDQAVELIRGTEDGRRPTLSPDGTELLFQSVRNEALKRVSVRGGTARTLTDSGGPASWGDGHRIVYAAQRKLYIATDNDAAPTILAAPDSSRGHVLYGFPTILPGGKAALLTIWKGNTAVESVWLGVVSIPDGKVRELGIRGTNPRYAASGHILYVTPEHSLLAVPFSVRSLRVTGASIPVAEDVQVGPGGAGGFTIAQNGTLAYVRGNAPSGERVLVAVSHTGIERTLGANRGYYQSPRVSPDGRSIAVTAYTTDRPGNQTGPNPDVWSLDINSGVMTRVTTDSASWRPEWTTNGDRLAYVRQDSGVVRAKSLIAGAGATALVRTTARIEAVSIGRTHGYIGLQVRSAEKSSDIWIVHTDSLASARPLLAEVYAEWAPRISPDGLLLAYNSRRTGDNEVYVRPLFSAGAEIRISVNGGAEPVWAPVGRKVFYRVQGYLMSALLSDARRLEIARRDTLFRDRFLRVAGSANYDVLPDGKEFVMLRAAESTPQTDPIVIVVNWSPARRAGAATHSGQ